MTGWFLVIVGLAWVGVFLPAAIRARETTPLTAAQRFKRRMDLIAPQVPRRQGRWVIVPGARAEARARAFARSQARRRAILKFLAIGTAVTGPIGMIASGLISSLATAFSVSLILYVGLLLGTKRQREEQSQKVRSLAQHRLHRDERVVFQEPIEATGGARN
ncbi:MAG: hypothetical protein ACLGHL_04100 [Actinomycetota bacterium]